jgi:hypothetical protein
MQPLTAAAWRHETGRRRRNRDLRCSSWRRTLHPKQHCVPATAIPCTRYQALVARRTRTDAPAIFSGDRIAPGAPQQRERCAILGSLFDDAAKAIATEPIAIGDPQAICSSATIPGCGHGTITYYSALLDGKRFDVYPSNVGSTPSVTIVPQR